MANQSNVIYKGRDNEVFIEFTFSGAFAVDSLLNFSEITLQLDTEIYSTVSSPALLFLDGNSTLVLKIGDTTSLDVGQYAPSIVGINTNYNDGYVLNCSSSSTIDRIIVKDC